MPNNFDLLVLGTGAGGGGVASRCAKAGWRVGIVDDQPPGGTCALRGCDPKKVLVGAASLIDAQNRLRGKGAAGNLKIDWAELMTFKRSFTDPIPAQRTKGFEAAGIEFYSGHAEFAGPDRVTVGEKMLEASHIVVATGAAPAVLNIEGESNVLTSTDFLELRELPKQVAFIGAGYISFEFAHIVQRAGSQAVILGRGQPLRHFDRDIVNRLVEHSREIGIDIRLDTKVTAVSKIAGGFNVHFEGSQGSGFVTTDLVIHGGGRTPNTSHLNAVAGGIHLDEKGAIRVNKFLQSVSNPKVYAAGDVVLPQGSVPLTPVGGHESAIVAHNLLHGNSRTPDYRAIPSVVFTVPALAGVGCTEEDAHSRGIPVRVKVEDTRSWFSAKRVGENASMFKTIVDEKTDMLLGAHLLGGSAEDVINIFALAMRHDIPASEIRRMIYAYPGNSSDISYMI